MIHEPVFAIVLLAAEPSTKYNRIQNASLVPVYSNFRFVHASCLHYVQINSVNCNFIGGNEHEYMQGGCLRQTALDHDISIIKQLDTKTFR